MMRNYAVFVTFLCGLTTSKAQDGVIYTLPSSVLSPTAKPGECSRRTLENGFTLPDKRRYAPNDFVDYFCNAGYIITGGLSSSACVEGKWLSELPKCVLDVKSKKTIECPYRALENGRSIPKKDTYEPGNRVGFRCNDNYERKGIPISKCKDDGEWSSKLPVCEEKLGKPKKCMRRAPVNGNIFPDHSSYENRFVVEYGCAVGYAISGENVDACFDGKWTITLPLCEVVTCAFRKLDNGVVNPTNEFYKAGSEVMYECKKGYQLDGDFSSMCTEVGVWSTELPVCKVLRKKVYCTPPKFSKGSYSPLAKTGNMKYSVGSSLTFRCNKLRNMKGYDKATCLPSGKWDQVPVCNVGCDVPKMKDGFYRADRPRTGKYFEPGHTLTFECSSSYRLKGAFSATCLKNGRWTALTPKCEEWKIVIAEVGCLPPHFPYGTYSPMLPPREATYSVGDKIYFQCAATYNIRGSAYATCSPSRKWSSIPSCFSGCITPKISHGTITFGDEARPYNTKISLNCDKGYLAIGKSSATCLRSGSWDAHLRCADGCRAPSIRHMKLSPEPVYGGQVYEFGHRVRFQCDLGYTSVGAVREAECRGDNRWDKILPKCRLLASNSATGCVLPRLAEGLVLKTQAMSVYPYKTQFEFECMKGFRMVGSAVSICRKRHDFQGGLDPSPPSCHRAKCGSPGEPQNGRFRDGRKNAYYFGDVVYFVCDEKHIMSGSDHIECQADGQFNGQPPLCRPPSCRVKCEYVDRRECQCDAACRIRRDCCGDFEQHCRKLFY